MRKGEVYVFVLIVAVVLLFISFSFRDSVSLSPPVCANCLHPENIVPRPQNSTVFSVSSIDIDNSWEIVTDMGGNDNFTAKWIHDAISKYTFGSFDVTLRDFSEISSPGSKQIFIGNANNPESVTFLSSLLASEDVNLQSDLASDRFNQGYVLVSNPTTQQVVIFANDSTGAFYGGMTLDWLLGSRTRAFFDGFESSRCGGAITNTSANVSACISTSIWSVQGVERGTIATTKKRTGTYSLYFDPDNQAVQSITSNPGRITAQGYDSCKLSFYAQPEDFVGTLRIRFLNSGTFEESVITSLPATSAWREQTLITSNPALMTNDLRVSIMVEYNSANRDLYIDDIEVICVKNHSLPDVKIVDWPDMNIRAFYGQAEQITLDGFIQNGNANKDLVDSLARYKYNLWTVAMGPGTGFLNVAADNSMKNYLKERHFYSSIGLLPQNIRYIDYRLYDGAYVENQSMSFTGRVGDWETAVSEDIPPPFLNLDFELNETDDPTLPDNWSVSTPNNATNYWAIDCTQSVSGSCSAKLTFLEDYRGTVNRSRRLYSYNNANLAPNKVYKINWWAKVNGNSGGKAPMVQMALRDAQGQTSLIGKVMPIGQFDWSNYSFVFSTSGFESAYIWTDLQEPAPLEYWIDNITFEEISNDLDNIIETNATRLHVWNKDRTREYVEGIDYYLNSSGVLNRQYPFVIPTNQLKTYLIRNESGNIPLDGNVSVDYDMLMSFYSKPDYTPRSMTLSDPLFYETYKQRFIDPGLDQVQPDFVWLAMDEIASYSGDSRAKKRNLTNAEIFGLAIRNISDMIHEASPNTTIIIWGDMLHPNHNGQPYYQAATGGVYGSTTEGMHYFDKNRTVVLQWWYDRWDVNRILRTSNTLYSSYGLRYFGGSWMDPINNKEWSEILYKDDAFGMLNHEFGGYLIPEGANYSWNTVKQNHPVKLTPGAIEYCDGEDNDANNIVDFGYKTETWASPVDEGFNLTNDVLNCGSCENACIFDMGFGSCNNGVCQLDSCFTGFNDSNSLLDDGCEVQLSAPECSVDADCNDSSMCTSDSCVSGTCVNTNVVDCSGLNGQCVVGDCRPTDGTCRAIPANTGGSCADGDLCTWDDFCWNGACVGFAANCTAFDSFCGVGTCQPGTGTCFASPINEGVSCEDGLWCTGSEICTQGTCVSDFTGDERCADGVTCTLNTCNENVDSCEATLVDSLCNSGMFCDGTEICTLTGCQPSQPACGIGEGCDENANMCFPLLCFINGTAETTEECDGSDFKNQNCVSLGYPSGGNLICGGTCEINTSSCSTLPSYTSFDGDDTTDFANLPDITSVSMAVLEVNGSGLIQFTGPTISFERLDLDKYVFIENKKIGIDISGPRMDIFENQSATLVFEKVNFTAPKVLVNGADCPASRCNITFYYSAIDWLVVNVSGFSNYTIVEGLFCGDGTCNNGETTTSCPGDCPVVVNNNPGGNPSSGTKKQCNDGRDNDRDGFADYPLDIGCVNRNDNNETNSLTPLPTGCFPQWICGAYSACVDGTRTRYCYDVHYCGLPVNSSMTSLECDFVPDTGSETAKPQGIFDTTRYDIIAAGVVILLGLSGLIVSIILLIISEAEYRKRNDY